MILASLLGQAYAIAVQKHDIFYWCILHWALEYHRFISWPWLHENSNCSQLCSNAVELHASMWRTHCCYCVNIQIDLDVAHLSSTWESVSLAYPPSVGMKVFNKLNQIWHVTNVWGSCCTCLPWISNHWRWSYSTPPAFLSSRYH